MKATWSPWHLSVPGHKSAQRLGASGGELDSSRFTSALYVGCRTGLELLGWGEPSGLSDCSPCFTRENLEVRSTGLGAAQLCPAVLFSAFCWNSSWRGLVEGGAALGSGQGETRTAGLLCHGARTPEGGKTPWETQAAPSKATPCGLETRPEWGHCMEHSRVLAWLGVDWVRFWKLRPSKEWARLWWDSWVSARVGVKLHFSY